MGLLDGKRALVTGGASGIGEATSRRLAREGATVVIVDVNEAAGRAVADQVEGHFVACDVSDSDRVASAFRQAADLLGGLDIAYLNAGVTTGQVDITQLTDEQYRRIVGINVDGVLFGAREAARIMGATGGAIVCTASIAGLIAYSGDPVYALTKHAVVGLVRALVPQLEAKGITINAICPGITETPLVGEQAAAALKAAGFPLVHPDAIAEAVVRAVTSGASGEAYVCQPDREPVRYEFRGVPGPRTPGAEGMRPPGLR